MKYQYWLSNIPGVGCKTIHRLLGQAGSAEEIYFLKKEQLEKLSGLSDRQVHAITDRKKNWDLEEKYAALGENGISFLSCEMESYPKQLRNIVDAPYSLYIKGKMPDFSKRRVEVVEENVDPEDPRFNKDLARLYKTRDVIRYELIPMRFTKFSNWASR